MQSKAEKIRSKDHPDVALKVIPGHFVTPNSHVNYFLDMTTLKCRLSEASANEPSSIHSLLYYNSINSLESVGSGYLQSYRADIPDPSAPPVLPDLLPVNLR